MSSALSKDTLTISEPPKEPNWTFAPEKSQASKEAPSKKQRRKVLPVKRTFLKAAPMNEQPMYLRRERSCPSTDSPARHRSLAPFSSRRRAWAEADATPGAG